MASPRSTGSCARRTRTQPPSSSRRRPRARRSPSSTRRTSTTAASGCAPSPSEPVRAPAALSGSQLDAARSRLAAHDAVRVDPVLADLVQARRIDWDRRRRRAHRMLDAVDVARPSAAGVARPELELDLRRAEPQPVFLHRALHTRETDARRIVVVESGALPGHPREYPGVHPVVLVDELEPPPLAVDADEGLPELGALTDAEGDVLELLWGQHASMRQELCERCHGRGKHHANFTK